ncbi:MAG: heterodisulfide reductase-related iron-sulfur binding cluster [Alphaproteobacteria bacterium]|jgi:glycerol-3-phosphate dehydrogenase subunit C|nr:heterodisulfide reductase-related iron-sulfur binding cluster [Alphaproteobacteria bacterium]MDP6516266.1 heterodisulfide reductase-related iron-sulfur binding cluster [Alphaproteobacteria bacterium]
MMEGGLDAPLRHAHGLDDPNYRDSAKLDEELRRVFDICHGCRRCFNLCDSFPRLFDLIDKSATGELDSVASSDFEPVLDACTLCDMCFMVSCPYVPPHEFDLDFPHLVLRQRAIRFANGKVALADRELARTDRNGRLAGIVAPLANWASATTNTLTRRALEALAGIHRQASLPNYHRKTFAKLATQDSPPINAGAPAYGRKAVLFATCFANYNSPEIGLAARRVLAHNGVETAVAYPGCCGMPQLEQGDFDSVVAQARLIAGALGDWLDRGYDVIAPVPSCALMLKIEWPLILPEDEAVKRLSSHTSDISEYVVDIAREEGLADGLAPLAGGITVHLACHARAQNMGPKAAEMLRLIPATELDVIERCSGHGGAWGIKKQFFEVALKTGKPAAQRALQSARPAVASECPLAGEHLRQGMERLSEAPLGIDHVPHPIQLLARAYGLDD